MIDTLVAHKILGPRSPFVITFTLWIVFSSVLANIGIFLIPQVAIAQPKSGEPVSPPSSSSSSPMATTTSSSFGKIYQNAILGLKIQYPSNWLVREHPYNATGNSTIVSFISPLLTPSTASSSGAAQNSFVPYVDIFVFDSKNVPLDQLVNGSVKSSLSNATLSQSKPITLKGNNPGRVIEYSIKIADRYLFDRMQLWTESGNRVFVLSYTAEPQTYLTYLPTMQKMIQSFEIPASPTTQLNNHSITINNEQHINASNDQKTNNTNFGSPPASSGNVAPGIPWLH